MQCFADGTCGLGQQGRPPYQKRWRPPLQEVLVSRKDKWALWSDDDRNNRDSNWLEQSHDKPQWKCM